MRFTEIIITNGFIPLIPIFLWNIAFAAKLPSAYRPEVFDVNIPKTIIFGETLFRIIIFALPLLLSLGCKTTTQKAGILLFFIGTLLYFTSWLILMFKPESVWSKSLFGFSAPAYTPLIWLIGLGLTVEKAYYMMPYQAWHYILPSIFFIIFHLSHSVYVFNKQNFHSNGAK